jgi:hypothetical protein
MKNVNYWIFPTKVIRAETTTSTIASMPTVTCRSLLCTRTLQLHITARLCRLARPRTHLQHVTMLRLRTTESPQQHTMTVTELIAIWQ